MMLARVQYGQSGFPGKLIYTHDPAYMDDLITPSATLISLQRKADIVTAFYIILGVDIAIQKLNSYEVNRTSGEVSANPTLLVHRED